MIGSLTYDYERTGDRPRPYMRNLILHCTAMISVFILYNVYLLLPWCFVVLNMNMWIFQIKISKIKVKHMQWCKCNSFGRQCTISLTVGFSFPLFPTYHTLTATAVHHHDVAVSRKWLNVNRLCLQAAIRLWPFHLAELETASRQGHSRWQESSSTAVSAAVASRHSAWPRCDSLHSQSQLTMPAVGANVNAKCVCVCTTVLLCKKASVWLLVRQLTRACYSNQLFIWEGYSPFPRFHPIRERNTLPQSHQRLRCLTNPSPALSLATVGLL